MPARDALHRPHQLLRGGILEQIAGGARLQGTADDDRVAVHAEHQDARARIVGPDGADQRQAAQSAALHGEIDDDDVRLMPARKLITGLDVARFEDRCHAAVLQHAPASLQHDRMVIDDQDRGHAARRGLVNGMTARTTVPPPGRGSIDELTAQRADPLLHAGEAKAARRVGCRSHVRHPRS